MHVMMRQMMALFDEYQSKENDKHTLRAMDGSGAFRSPMKGEPRGLLEASEVRMLT